MRNIIEINPRESKLVHTILISQTLSPIDMEEYMRNTPLPSYDHYGYEARKRRGQVTVPPSVFQVGIEQNQISKKRRRRRNSSTTSEAKDHRYESTSMPHSFYAVSYSSSLIYQ